MFTMFAIAFVYKGNVTEFEKKNIFASLWRGKLKLDTFCFLIRKNTIIT